MQNDEDSSVERSERETLVRMSDTLPAAGPVATGKTSNVEKVLADAKKQAAEADALSDDPRNIVGPLPEPTMPLGPDGWDEAALDAKRLALQVDEAIARDCANEDAALDQGLHWQEYFKRVAGRGQKHAQDQSGASQKDRQDEAAAVQPHAAAQAAARAKEAIERSSVRQTAVTPGRSF